VGLRLTFGTESAKDGRWVGLEGEDATAIIEAWNASGWWSIYPPAKFRQRLADSYGLDTELPADDEALLEAIVAKDASRVGPASEELRLERRPPR
jgi:hypothetical protein